MRIFFKHRGNFNRTERWLTNSKQRWFGNMLKRYGAMGVDALSRNTPIDTSETANSWYYTVDKTSTGWKLSWSNSKMAGTVPLVILLQYGHGTRGGSWVEGRDFINPAMRPILDDISQEIWKEVLHG